MRVFVLGTGRCGSMTFAKACGYITNYTSAHESSQRGLISLYYKDNHIEVDTHLTWSLPLLLDLYPVAVWVHLKRDKTATMASMKGRYGLKALNACIFPGWYNEDRLAALNYGVKTRLIERLIPNALTVELDDFRSDFELFWDTIGAEGDKEKALAELDKKYNATDDKQEDTGQFQLQGHPAPPRRTQRAQAGPRY